MKTKNIAFMLLAALLLFSPCYAQISQPQTRLHGMSTAERDRFLIGIAKDVYKREMPDAYVEYGTPLISKRTAPINNIEESEFYVGKETGVNYFCITFS